MRLGLFLLFLAIPVIELALLIKVGQYIGVWPTVGIVVGTALVGGTIFHRQGFQTLERAMQSVRQGQPPIDPMIDGAFLLLAGGLLVSPGLITDALGLALLIPAVRRLIAKHLFKTIVSRVDVRVDIHERGGPTERSGPGVVIDGEYETLDEKERPPQKLNEIPRK